MEIRTSGEFLTLTITLDLADCAEVVGANKETRKMIPSRTAETLLMNGKGPSKVWV